MTLFKKSRWIVMALIIACTFLTACGTSDVEPDGELSVIDEQGEKVTLTNKERATILFHFTEVG